MKPLEEADWATTSISSNGINSNYFVINLAVTITYAKSV